MNKFSRNGKRANLNLNIDRIIEFSKRVNTYDDKNEHILKIEIFLFLVYDRFFTKDFCREKKNQCAPRKIIKYLL